MMDPSIWSRNSEHGIVYRPGETTALLMLFHGSHSLTNQTKISTSSSGYSTHYLCAYIHAAFPSVYMKYCPTVSKLLLHIREEQMKDIYVKSLIDFWSKEYDQQTAHKLEEQQL